LVRYAYALTAALLVGGAAASMTLQPPAGAQTAQNEPGAINAAAPRAGAPMSFAEMVAKLQPAVVNISTKQRVTVNQGANPFAGTPFGELFGFGQRGGQGGNGAPITREGQSLGSGFIISPDGYVVTNNHVISAGTRNATVESITVTLSDRREYTARLIGKDPTSDLALLKIDAGQNLPFVRFGNSTNARVGDWVVAIGNPFGLGGSVTAGIVSSVNRVTQGGPFDRFIQTDASINQGNSGGPLFDMQGNVIGINSQILSPTGGNVGIGFAIPADQARPIIDTLRRGETVRRGYLGVGIQPVSDDIANALGLPANRGEIISRVEPGQPGDRAGLRQGDVVVSVGGKEVTPDQTLSFLVAGQAPGARIPLEVVRDGRRTTVNVTLGTRPSEEQLALNPDGDDDGLPGEGTGPQAPAGAPLGLQVIPLTPQIARQINVDAATRGVVVVSADPASDAAANRGIRRGDVIVSVNRQPVTTPGELASAVTAARAAGRESVLLYVQRARGQGGFTAVRLR
jgi:serine protease Do